jgi:hypothetical protein
MKKFLILALLLSPLAAFGQLRAKTLAPAGAHQVSLTCTPAGTGGKAVGFVFLRGTVKGGPYTQQGLQQTTCAFVDSDPNFIEGTTYYYVSRAVNAGGFQSGNSNEAPALIPFLPCDPPIGLSATTQ